MSTRREQPPDNDKIERVERLAQRAIEVLARNADLRAHFKNDLKWLEERVAIWSSRSWRVGLIGITSAGKSTLVNALLGERVLPARVRPSSNTLVVCRKGAKKGTIHYHHREPEEVRGGRLESRLSDVADETTNPGNREGVAEIEVSWPTFLLGDDVALVDTPGLDAYGLEPHEKLTMETLLPSVDAVIFLTTAKANADGRIAEYLDQIGDHGKPVVLVQNMADSIEQKLGSRGRVLKSRDEVAAEHQGRLQRLLEGRRNSVLKRAPVIQVSALWALEGRAEASGLDALVRAVRRHLEKLQPKLERGRYRQLHRELKELVTREIAAGDELAGAKEVERRTGILDRCAEQLRDLGSAQATSLKECQEWAAKCADELLQQVSALSERDIEGGEELARQFVAWMERPPEWLGKITRENLKALRAAADKLNLSDDDLRLEMSAPPKVLKIQVPTKNTPVETTVNRTEWWASAARLLRLGGTKKVTSLRTDLDVDEFRRLVSPLIAAERQWIDSTVTQLRQGSRRLEQKLQAEIDRQRAELERQRTSTLKVERRREAAQEVEALLADDLSPILDAAEGRSEAERSDAEPVPTGLQVERVNVEIGPLSSALVHLSGTIARRRFLMARQVALDAGAPPGGSRRRRPRAMIWGFDSDAIERFLVRFWPELADVGIDHAFTAGHLVPGLEAVAIGLESSQKAEASALERRAAAFLAEEATIFLLLDADQPGATRSQLGRSPLLRCLDSDARIVVVVQSIQGLRQSGEVGQGLLELQLLLQDAGLQPQAMLVNDDDIGWSALAHRLFTEGAEWPRTGAELAWLEAAGTWGPEVRAEMSEVIKLWRDQGKARRAEP